MRNKHIRIYPLTIIAVCLFNLVNAQQSAREYHETVINIPGLESDKTYQAIELIYKSTAGVEIMIRCKRSEMLVLKIDTRVHADPDKLLKRIVENNFKATIVEGYDYNKVVATCSDFKPE